jgi:hypothetical protein
VRPSQALLDHAVGEAAVYVQGASLKTVAVFPMVRLSNSPITRLGQSGLTVRPQEEWGLMKVRSLTWLACTLVGSLLLASSSSSALAAPTDASAVAAMQSIQAAWKRAVSSGRPMLSACAHGTWAVGRIASDTLITMDVRRTDSVVDPLEGVITIFGYLESNSHGPNADGFDPQYSTAPGFFCYKTQASARSHMLPTDWKPSNGKPSDPIKMVLRYKITPAGAALRGGDTFFVNALSGSLLLPENRSAWADAIGPDQ